MSKIILIIVLLLGLGVGVYLISQQTNLKSKASPDEAPQNPRVSNISDNSFSVSWTTSNPASGFLSYGTSDKLGNATADDRDKGKRESRVTHHVTVKNLAPSTTYYYKIGSGSKLYSDNGQAFKVTTAPTTKDAPPVANPIYGTVRLSNGSAPLEALVFVKYPNATLLSSYTREKGNWLITLNNARTEDLSSYIKVSDTDEIEVFADGANNQTGRKVYRAKDKETVLTVVLSSSNSVSSLLSSSPTLSTIGGKVINASGTGVNGVKVWINDESSSLSAGGKYKSVTSGPDGKFKAEVVTGADGFWVRIPDAGAKKPDGAIYEDGAINDRIFTSKRTSPPKDIPDNSGNHDSYETQPFNNISHGCWNDCNFIVTLILPPTPTIKPSPTPIPTPTPSPSPSPKDDTTAPTTTIALNPASGFSTGQTVTMTFNGTDNAGGSGLNIIHTAIWSGVSTQAEVDAKKASNPTAGVYQGVKAGKTRTATVPFYIEYLGEDSAKNLETTHTLFVKPAADTTPPTTTITLNPGSGFTSGQSVTVTFTAVDQGGSSVKAIHTAVWIGASNQAELNAQKAQGNKGVYRGFNASGGSRTVTVPSAIEYLSEDSAKNLETTHTLFVKP